MNITYPTFLDGDGNRFIFPTVYYTEQFPKGSEEITIVCLSLQVLGLNRGEDIDVTFREDGYAELMFLPMNLNSPALKGQQQQVYVIEGPIIESMVELEKQNATVN